MVKIETAKIEYVINNVVKNIKEVDWKRLRQKIKIRIGELTKVLRNANRRDKTIVLAAVVLVLIVVCVSVFMHGKKYAKMQNTSEPNLNNTLADNKADIEKSAQENVPQDNSWIADINIPSMLASLSKGNVESVYKNRTIKVPLEYPSIQKAIDAAKSGDTVLVSAGQYNENIIMKDGVSVVGEKAGSTILDGQKNGNVVTFKDISNVETRLENFTVKDSGENLGGILIDNSSPLINRNIILQNDYDIYIKGESSPTIQRNTLQESKAGVQIFNLDQPKNSNPIVLDNIITDNKKGVNVYKGSVTINHNTISYNSILGDDVGATFGIYLASAGASISNNIITDNGICEICSGIYADADSANITISYNDLWNNQSNFVCFGKCDMQDNNLSDDPHFGNGLQADFSLKPDSPFLTSGSDGQKLGARL